MKKPLLLGIILTACVVIVAFVFSLGYPGGMISYWKFDESSGTTASDSVDANNGTLVNGPGWTTAGMVNGALSFDGIDDYVNAGTGVNLKFGTGAFTIEAWIYPNSLAGKGGATWFVSRHNNVDSVGFRFGYWGGLVFRDRSTGDDVKGSLLTTGIWTHVIAVREGIGTDQLKLYINGVLDKVGTSWGNFNDDSPLYIGRPGGLFVNIDYFDGKIDEVAIYNRALSVEEIQHHYQDGLDGLGYDVECILPPSGMVSWWPGDGNADDIVDGNHGALQNGATYAAGKVDKAFSFDGVDDNVEVPDDPTLDITDSITLEAWVKADSTQTGNAAGIITKDDLYSDGRSYNLHLSSASSPTPWALRMRLLTLSNDGIIDGTTDLRDNTWHHVAGTWDGSIMNLYVDGILQNSRSSTGSISITSTPVIIGDFGSSGYGQYGFAGLIDEVEIFDYALSQEEIQAIYNAGSAGKCKEAVVIEVTIDIKPGSDPNSINLGDHGLLPVAILGTQDFDVTTINPENIVIGGVSLAERGSKKAPKLAYSLEDVDGDGFTDMITFFDVQELVILGVLAEGTTELLLTATLDDGTPIEGTDSVNIVN